MKSIEKRCEIVRESHPYQYNSLICFGRAVYRQKFTRQYISRWFSILVDPEVYLQEDGLSIRMDLIKHFMKLTNWEPKDHPFEDLNEDPNLYLNLRFRLPEKEAEDNRLDAKNHL